MKRLLLLSSLFCFATLFAQDPVVMNINGEDVKLSEFEYIWNKNNSNQVADSNSLEEYVDMFVTFKLKVAAGKEAGLDTLASFKNELAGYRNQLTPQYLKLEATEKALQEECYQLMQTYLELSHILIAENDDNSALQTAENILQRIEKGESFEALAKEFSKDNSRNNGGYLGTTLASRYIYPFAKAAMQLENGEISQPVKTQFGYHIIKMHNKKASIGQYESGHILKTLSPNATDDERAKAKEEIFDIYREIKAGRTFEDMANGYHNDDRYVVGNNGRYPLLRGGSLPIEYEDALLALKDGEYSRPFESKYGWHMVKRYSISEFPPMESLMQEINQMLQRDERREMPSYAFSEQLKKEYNYQEDSHALQLLKITLGERDKFDEATKRVLNKFPDIASFADQKLSAAGFIEFLNSRKELANDIDKAWNQFVHKSLIAYEDKQLESKYPAFGHLMQEYHDGILLFEISNREVWNKASTDTVGLEKFFKSHKKDFRWEQPRFSGVLVGCHEESLVKEVKKLAKSLPIDSIAPVLLRTYNNDSTYNVRVDKGVFFKGGSNPMVNKVVFNEGDWTPNGHYPYFFYVGKIQKQPKTVDDVRGQATAKYQDYLEATWVAALKEKYPVKIYQEVIDTLK